MEQEKNPILPTASLDDVAAQIRKECSACKPPEAPAQEATATTTQKKISQETFDDVVRENMEEFEMSEEEAMQDAIEQFKQQGVDLSGIVTSLDAKRVDARLAELVESLNQVLKDPVEDPSIESLLSRLEELARECSKGDEERIAAGRHGAVGAAAFVCKKYSKEEAAVKQALELIGELMKVFENREIIPLQGVEAIVSCLEEHKEKAHVHGAGFSAVTLTVAKHEENKRNFKLAGINAVVTESLRVHEKSKETVTWACKFMRTYLSDDDRRPGVHPGTFPRARELGENYEAGVLPSLIALLGEKDVLVDEKLTRNILATIKAVAVNDVICKHISTKGGLDAILVAFEVHIGNEPVVTNACQLLKAVTRNDDIKRTVGKGKGLGLLLRAMDEHSQSARVAEQALQCLSVLCLRQPANCETIAELGCLQLIVAAMRSFPDEAGVQRPAISTLRNMVSSWQNKELKSQILDEGAENLIRDARTKHPEVCEEVAFAALRDLGCDYHA